MIKTPKKYDSVYLAKICLNTSPFIFHITDVKIVKVKTFSDIQVISFKVSGSQMKKLLLVEERVVQYVYDNVAKWFNNRMDAKVVEEYFESNICVDKKYGKIFKIRIDKTDIDFKNSLVNVMLHPHHLKFNKKSFNIQWSVQEIEYKKNSIKQCDEISLLSNDSAHSEDELIFGPDNDDILEIKMRLGDKLNKCLNKNKEKIKSLSSENVKLTEEIDKLNNFPDLKTLESIQNTLNEYGIE